MSTAQGKQQLAITAQAPIGIFDSGVGGLTVARTIMEQLPHESVIYIGDTAHSPYGSKPIAQVRELSLKIADELVRRGCKMIVIACNTATSAALRDVRERHNIPVLGVISPAVRRAVSTTRNGKVGVIGTEGTINSGAYQELFSVNPQVECFVQACPRFVDFVERGITAGRQILGVAQAYVEPLQAAGVDTLVLGCTHYPLLSGVIQLAIGDHVTLVSSAEETAKDVMRTLTQHDMLASAASEPPMRSFGSTGDPELFAHLASRFLSPHVMNIEQLGNM
ncbi:glutamate racemase [Corynebacterium sp. sy017]|uniref:glutamate racemase n=1 Tax=unclassified Corynebacterium TaxID=2624378 RepID=UPI001184D835|nr:MULTISPECIES: glutamate racemase [unclassified Corynebacterium]MBP3088168.1 glutamate racemase [Corynebacterium sp. sy017]TSD92674.1 glutamate racemase [Corynebacterium sp. SY003]